VKLVHLVGFITKELIWALRMASIRLRITNKPNSCYISSSNSQCVCYTTNI